MLISKENRRAIYEHLFREGVMVAKKDFRPHNHPELETIPNLQVIKTMQSLRSRGYVTEQFSWQSYYWYLTNEGIQYLRDFLHLPPEIVPSTLTRQRGQRAPRQDPANGAAQAPRGDAAGNDKDRQDYRRGAGVDKKADAGAGVGDIQFRAGGFGRGK